MVSLVLLPVVLSIRQRHSIPRGLSIWETAYHLVSGNHHGSFVSSSNQRTLTLLICGLVALLIQYPFTLLKGEVVSSPYELRIQPSKCVVNSCDSIGWRADAWFRRGGETSIESLIYEENLYRGCPAVSQLSSGMMNLTKLASLLKYRAICDDPELMKLQLIPFRSRLVFELITASRATQPVCSTGQTHGGQLNFTGHMRTARRILEHNLLKYHHVRAALISVNRFEQTYWGNYKKKNTDRTTLVKKIEDVVSVLEDKYSAFKMSGYETDTNIMTPRIGLPLFEAFLVINFTIFVLSALFAVLIYTCRERLPR